MNSNRSSWPTLWQPFSLQPVFLTYLKRNFQRLGIPRKDWGWGGIQQSHLGSTDGSKHREHSFPVSWQLPSKFRQTLRLQVLRFVTPQRAVRFQLVTLGGLIARERVLESDLSCLSLERGPFKIFCLSIYPEMWKIRRRWVSLLFTSAAFRDFRDSFGRCRGNAMETLRLAQTCANPCAQTQTTRVQIMLPFILQRDALC